MTEPVTQCPQGPLRGERYSVVFSLKSDSFWCAVERETMASRSSSIETNLLLPPPLRVLFPSKQEGSPHTETKDAGQRSLYILARTTISKFPTSEIYCGSTQTLGSFPSQHILKEPLLDDFLLASPHNCSNRIIGLFIAAKCTVRIIYALASKDGHKLVAISGTPFQGEFQLSQPQRSSRCKDTPLSI